MKAAVDPVVWLWLGVVIGASFCLLRGRKRLGLVLLTLALVTCIAEVVSLPARLLATLERPYLSDKLSTGEPADVVLVLGGYGQLFPQSSPGIELNEAGDRLIRGIDIIRNGWGSVLLISGGGTGTPPEPLEAQATKAWIDSLKVLPRPVEIMPPSLNTREEALRLANMARTNGWKKIILVTSAWHMRRAAAVCRKAGVEIYPAGCDFQGSAALHGRHRLSLIPRTGSIVIFKLWLEETLGYGYYRLRGWV